MSQIDSWLFEELGNLPPSGYLRVVGVFPVLKNVSLFDKCVDQCPYHALTYCKQLMSVEQVESSESKLGDTLKQVRKFLDY